MWDEASKTFRLSNGTSANADVSVNFIPSCSESPMKSLQETGGFPLMNQMKFKTGLIEWTVSPVPQRKLIISRLFDALRKNDIIELGEQWLYAESWNNYLKKLNVDRSVRNLYLINSNTEEDPDYRIINEQAKKTPKFSDEVTDAPPINDGNFGSAGKFSLLHIAVDYLFLEGVRFLLEKGAEVRGMLIFIFSLFLKSNCKCNRITPHHTTPHHTTPHPTPPHHTPPHHTPTHTPTHHPITPPHTPSHHPHNPKPTPNPTPPT